MITNLLDVNDVPLSEAAIAYLDAELPVFPCRAGRKEPATGPGGFKKSGSSD